MRDIGIRMFIWTGILGQFHFDFITLVNNISFEEAIKEVNYFPVGNNNIPVIQYHHLILTKSGTSRLKDLADIEELNRINKYRNQP